MATKHSDLIISEKKSNSDKIKALSETVDKLFAERRQIEDSLIGDDKEGKPLFMRVTDPKIAKEESNQHAIFGTKDKALIEQGRRIEQAHGQCATAVQRTIKPATGRDY